MFPAHSQGAGRRRAAAAYARAASVGLVRWPNPVPLAAEAATGGAAGPIALGAPALASALPNPGRAPQPMQEPMTEEDRAGLAAGPPRPVAGAEAWPRGVVRHRRGAWHGRARAALAND
ncbi:MAG: hypothetical protein AMJ69_04895 [Gammaproteobacteria bacterium SG8_47]|nr:MAG: hypothetical protein AMJ69_04895 [Gammaproteobacteria bacterium SG8_47]